MRLFGATASVPTAITALSLGVATATAANVPDMVGTWKLTGEMHASVRLGDDNDHHPEYAEPNFGSPGDAWTLVIEGQKGRAFHGYSMSPKGAKEPIVGVVSHNGQRVLISAMEAALHGEFVGADMEVCYMDHEDDRAAVACFMAAKE